MIRILLITIFLCGVLFTCGCSQNKTDIDELEYSEKLDKVYNSINQSSLIENEDIYNVIPKNDYEFKFFIEKKKSNSTNEEFYKLDSIIGKLAFNNVDSFLKAYLDMAKFITYETVDDQYFQDFYYDADFIIEHNKLTFCKLYPELKNKSKEYLIDFYEDYCSN